MIRRALVFVLAVAALGPPPGARADHPGDRTGVTPETLTIGLHSSFTGASPLPPNALAEADLYWRFLHDDRGILVHGRRVEVELRDDTGKPSTAVAVCDELASTSFLLAGFSGPDQIQACANYADPRGIPYLSPGVQEAGLADRATYFAVSPTFSGQAGVVAEFIVNHLGAAADRYGIFPTVVVPVLDLPLLPRAGEGADGDVRIALVRPNTPNYNEAETRLREELELRGESLDLVISPVKEGPPPSDTAARMESRAIDVVVTLTGPLATFRLIDQLNSADYRPGLVGFAMTAGFNNVTTQACERDAGGAVQGASFFSAWPGWPEVMDGAFDPDFAAAAAKYAPDANRPVEGDLLLALWGLMKDFHAMLEALGPDPTREDLIAMLEGGHTQATGVYPPLAFSSEDHFGADVLHRLEADCGDGLLHQKEAFVGGYEPPSDGS